MNTVERHSFPMQFSLKLPCMKPVQAVQSPPVTQCGVTFPRLHPDQLVGHCNANRCGACMPWIQIIFQLLINPPQKNVGFS